MPKSPRGGSRQPELFPRSKRPTVPIEENHRLVQLADRLDWTEMEVRAEELRAAKLKNAAGRPPKLRPLLGAMVLRATRYMPYRVLEDQIRHYAPARYLCGLVADTAAQETETPYPNEMGLMAAFIASLGAACNRAGEAFKQFAGEAKSSFEAAKKKAPSRSSANHPRRTRTTAADGASETSQR